MKLEPIDHINARARIRDHIEYLDALQKERDSLAYQLSKCLEREGSFLDTIFELERRLAAQSAPSLPSVGGPGDAEATQ